MHNLSSTAGTPPAKPDAVMSSTFTRVFLSFAPQDANYRSLLVAATRAAGLPVRFVEMPNSVTDARHRRVLSRAKLQQCDMAVVLVSPHATESLPIAADIEAVRDAGLPAYGVMAGGTKSAESAPAEWGLSNIVGWSWAQIMEFLQQLDRLARPLPVRAAC